MMLDPSVLHVLARALLAGEPEPSQLVMRARRALRGPRRCISPLADRYAAFVAGRARPRFREVAEFLENDHGFRRARKIHAKTLAVQDWLTGHELMQPVPAAAQWEIPAIETEGDLAGWLGVSAGELDWFADLKALGYKQPREPLAHYHYRALAKQFGSIRLIEAPKPRLKEMQRRILSAIIERIPAHSAAHGFIKGRSIHTFAAPHVGKRVVLRMDLQDFFPSISGPRVQALFRTAGYPESVADTLGGICTNATPRCAWRVAAKDVDPQALWQAADLYARPHLPQGAPTSPALANLSAYRVDCRLIGLARWAGAEYTRYADDLAFSGGEDFEDRVERFATYAAVILAEEGFRVHHRKTRVMRQGVRQYLAGLVVNQRANVVRADLDRLKATLTNCLRHGPESQNRDEHPDFRAWLSGKIAFVESVNPEKGSRLRGMFQRIEW